MSVRVPTIEEHDALVAATGEAIADLDNRVAALEAAATPPEPEPEPEPKSVAVGTSLHRETGEDHQAAFDRRTTDWGAEPEVVRLFDDDMGGVPSAWPAKFGGAWPLWSWKVWPRDILSGSADDDLAALFRKAPTNRIVRWSYWHEPEDDVEDDGSFTAADWRNAFDYINAFRDEWAPDPSKVPSGPILMGWTVNPKSHRNPLDYTISPGPYVKFYGWDVYTSKGPDIETGYSLCRDYTASVSKGLKWLLAEAGPKPPSDYPDKTGYVNQSINTARKLGAFAYCYFDSTVGGDFRLKLQTEWDAIGEQIRRD